MEANVLEAKKLYRHADGDLHEAPERGANGKITQRYHVGGVNVGHDGMRWVDYVIFERTAPILQRSLASVGGVRAGRQYTRRKNRQARAAGFSNYHRFLQHLFYEAQRRQYARGAA